MNRGNEKIYRKILFCTDLYAGSDYAFAAVLDLAERTGAELIVLHVLESRHRYSGHVITDDGEVWAGPEVYEKLRKKLRDYYALRIESQHEDLLRIEVRGGIPWVEILRFARKEAVDLIVMGSYTLRGSEEEEKKDVPDLGENARQVSLRARCQVSIVTSPKQRLFIERAGTEEQEPA